MATCPCALELDGDEQRLYAKTFDDVTVRHVSSSLTSSPSLPSTIFSMDNITMLLPSSSSSSTSSSSSSSTSSLLTKTIQNNKKEDYICLLFCEEHKTRYRTDSQPIKTIEVLGSVAITREEANNCGLKIYTTMSKSKNRKHRVDNVSDTMKENYEQLFKKIYNDDNECLNDDVLMFDTQKHNCIGFVYIYIIDTMTYFNW